MAILMPARAQDTQLIPDSLRRYIPPGMRLVVGRGFVLPIQQVDSAHLRGRSGTFWLGIQMNAPIHSERFGIHAQPCVSWTYYNYKIDSLKKFPSSLTNLTAEKHKLLFVEVPIGVSFNLSLDTRKKPLVWVEAGFFVGYRLLGSYRTKSVNTANQVIDTRTSRITEPNTLRTGLYGRLGYKDVCLTVSQRLSAVYTAGYPMLPRTELGLMLRL